MTVVKKASLNGSRHRGHSPGSGSVSRVLRLDIFRYFMLLLCIYSVFVTVALMNGAASGAKAEVDKEKSQMRNTILSLQKRIKEMAPKSKVDREKIEMKEKIASLQRRIKDMTSEMTPKGPAIDNAPPKTRYLRDETPRRGEGASKVWTTTDHTMSKFEVAGVNLARYGIGSGGDKEGKTEPGASKFQLFEDFSIADKIIGNESWDDLLAYRRKLRRLGLSFYVDKVALKRWLPSIGVHIPKPFYLMYKSELPTNDAFTKGAWQGVSELIPREVSFAAKPGHLQHGMGVYLVNYKKGDGDSDDDVTAFVSEGAENLEEFDGDYVKVPKEAAKFLAEHLQKKADRHRSSWASEQVEAGLVIEERYALWDHDNRPAMHFQVIVIWGKVYLALWGRGLHLWGLVNRDGEVMDWEGKSKHHSELPDYVDWTRVVETAEKMGAHKDMLRVDIFVGVPADSPALDEDATDEDRRAAVQIVLSDCELVAKLDLGDPSISEEAARLWIAGYNLGNYDIIPNAEIPDEYFESGLLKQPPETKNWIKTPHTFAEFDILGVNLATYQMPSSNEDDENEQNSEPFELYGNFDISEKITGNENWWTLVEYRRELARPGLNFYVDKVAQKRWLPSIGMPIPRPFLTRYRSEVPEYNETMGTPFLWETINTMLPQESNYAAKPSHTSCSDGVWLVKYEDGVLKVGAGSQIMEEVDEDKIKKIAKSLAKNLHEEPRDLESFALKNVSPGLVVEERFTAWDSDDKSAMEFKIFCFWGRVWLANWRRGSDRWGLVHRDGRVVDWAGKQEGHEVIPDWVQWPRVIEIAEKMAAHKDMFRVDIFVGVPASSPTLKGDVTDDEKRAAVEIVISEFEVHPTTKFKDPRLFEEAARLWIAGYKKLKIKTVPNNEVPISYLQTGVLPQPPDTREWVKTKHTTTYFEVAGVDLAPYGISEKAKNNDITAVEEAEPFELYEEFDIGDIITGNEPWWDLIMIRLGLENRPGLPFYNDKVALRRWLPSVGIPMPKSFALKYGSELTESGEEKEEMKAIMNLLPEDEDFVAKPSHSCFGDDVWIVKHEVDEETGKRTVSVSGGIGTVENLKEVKGVKEKKIGKALAKTLHYKPGTYGSWLYDNIKPGIVVEERFASLDDDRKPAMEFKVFTIWGKCFVAQWRRGTYNGVVYPDGRVVEWSGSMKKYTKLPDWVDWSKVAKLAEQMGAHKDMFRTDIFVGVPAGSQALRQDATEEERRDAVQVVVSEFELQPGTTFMDPGIFDDAARLWIAGYRIGNYRVVKNAEIPSKYLKKGSLAEDDVPNKSVK